MTTDEGSAYKRRTVGFGAMLPEPSSEADNNNYTRVTPPGIRLWEARAGYTLSAIGLAGSNIIYTAASLYSAFQQSRTPHFLGSACYFFDQQIREQCRNAQSARRELLENRKTKSTVSAPTPPR